MAEFKLYYPEWKEKALTFSYDDGQIYDRRLAEIFDRYQLKATFHLNSGTLDKEGFVGAEELAELYGNHEIACHGASHEYPTHLAQERLNQEYYQDRNFLEEKSGRIIRGCSYAFGEYDKRTVDTLRMLGFSYCRTVEETGNFKLPADFMRWEPSCHHNEAFEGMAEKFLNTPSYQRIPLLYIWGHSFEFERENTWKKMEELCGKLSGRENIWYATNQEIADYLTTARNLIFSINTQKVMNLSKIKIYVKVNGEYKIV